MELCFPVGTALSILQVRKSNTTFYRSRAGFYGGAISLNNSASLSVMENAAVLCNENTAVLGDGALYCNKYCKIAIEDVAITHNQVTHLGGVYCVLVTQKS